MLTIMATLFCLKIQLWCNLSTPLSFCKVPFPPTFMPCDLSEESSLSCYARHPWLCSPSARSSARGTARMSREPRMGACSSSRGFAEHPRQASFLLYPWLQSSSPKPGREVGSPLRFRAWADGTGTGKPPQAGPSPRPRHAGMALGLRAPPALPAPPTGS